VKRSEINDLIRQAVEFFARHRFQLPPFAFWSPDEWAQKGPEVDEIRICRLGWDLTDFGAGEFDQRGLLLFTVRNGRVGDPAYQKSYAEKIMIVREGQVTPWHFHAAKTEDIINRGGGQLAIDLTNCDGDGRPVDSDVEVSTDGVRRTVAAGGRIVLGPGESITITQGLAHQFYGWEGTADVLVGEVSFVNDDETDNYFLEPAGRFPEIEEDEPPLFLLCTEYPAAV